MPKAAPRPAGRRRLKGAAPVRPGCRQRRLPGSCPGDVDVDLRHLLAIKGDVGAWRWRRPGVAAPEAMRRKARPRQSCTQRLSRPWMRSSLSGCLRKSKLSYDGRRQAVNRQLSIRIAASGPMTDLRPAAEVNGMREGAARAVAAGRRGSRNCGWLHIAIDALRAAPGLALTRRYGLVLGLESSPRDRSPPDACRPALRGRAPLPRAQAPQVTRPAARRAKKPPGSPTVVSPSVQPARAPASTKTQLRATHAALIGPPIRP